jgi:hypothetical protein
MPPVRLSDEELSAVMTAAQPLEPSARNAFLVDVANALAGCAVIGPGVVHRVCSEIQRRHFDAPETRRPRPRRREIWLRPRILAPPKKRRAQTRDRQARHRARSTQRARRLSARS